MKKSEIRKQFGVSMKPIQATRVFTRPMEGDFGGKVATVLLTINDKAGTFTSANVYDGNAGKGYDAECMTHPLPAPDDAKWKKWAKAGYKVGSVDDWALLELIEADGEVLGPIAEVAQV